MEYCFIMSIEGTSKSDNILLNSQNRETWKKRFRWETNSDDVKNLEKTFLERELSKIAQSRKGYLASLTRCINRAVDLLKRPNNFSDVALISEKLEFALFKLERVTDEYVNTLQVINNLRQKHYFLKIKTAGK